MAIVEWYHRHDRRTLRLGHDDGCRKRQPQLALRDYHHWRGHNADRCACDRDIGPGFGTMEDLRRVCLHYVPGFATAQLSSPSGSSEPCGTPVRRCPLEYHGGAL